MKIQVLYNNIVAVKGFIPAWGFSCLIDDRILFDTGEHADILLHNIDKFGIKLSQIEKVVISHDHYDHRDGLWGILKRRPGLPVFVCRGFSEETRTKIKESGGRLQVLDDSYKLEKDVFIFGVYDFIYKGVEMTEQCLGLLTNNGITVLAGCSHPGITTMLAKVNRMFGGMPHYLAGGGFHLKDSGIEEIEETMKKIIEYRFKKVAPTHCSGAVAQDICKRYFQKNCLDLGVGTEIIV